MHAIVWSGTRHVGVVAARLEGKRLARPCLDCLDSLTFGLRAQLAPSQFIATKPSEEARTGPAEYLEPLQSCRGNYILLKHSAHSLV